MTKPLYFIVVLLFAFTSQSCLAQTIDFAPAGKVLEAAVRDGAFPGCSIAVGTSEQVLWVQGFGRFAYDESVTEASGLKDNPRITPETVYDLASLTKVVSTTSVVMALIRDEKLRLKDTVADILPSFRNASEPRRNDITIEQLLAHASGLPAWKPFYREHQGAKDVLQAVAGTPLVKDPGTHYAYSDLGFILLGEIAVRRGERSLSRLEKELIFGPLGMESTLRNPPPELRSMIPPTERDALGEVFLQGVVHDENCRAAGGVTGHAGLFSNVIDLSKFAAELLRADDGQSGLFPKDVFKIFAQRREMIAGSSRALGWDTPSGRSSGGKNISSDAIGHTGFTGTSMWIDFRRDIYFILLSNRVHPTRDNRRISDVRHKFANAVLASVDEKN